MMIDDVNIFPENGRICNYIFWNKIHVTISSVKTHKSVIYAIVLDYIIF